MSLFPSVRTGRAWIGFTLAAGLCLALSFTPLAVWPLTGIYMLGIPAVLLCTVCAGWLPGAVSAAICCAAIGRMLGPYGAALTAVYLIPALVTFLILYARRVPFWKAVAVEAGVILLSQVIPIVWLNAGTAQGLFNAVGEAARQAIERHEMGNTLLYTLYRYGFLELNTLTAENMLESAGTPGAYMLSEAARSELLLALTSTVSDLMYGLLPHMLISHTLLSAVMGIGFSLHRGAIHRERVAYIHEDNSRNPEVDKLGMEPFEKWHLPRGVGIRVALMGLGYFLTLLADSGPLPLMGGMMYSAFSAVYTVQGVAALYGLQKQKGRSAVWRFVAPVLLYMFLPNVLKFLGLIDQVVDFRHLRPPLNEENDHREADE